MNQHDKPEALLLISTHCPHCHVLQTLLEKRLSQGQIKSLTVVNIDETEDAAIKYKVRSVPWLKLGIFEFNGSLTPVELDHWIAAVSEDDGSIKFLQYLMENGKLQKVIEWLDEGKTSLQEFSSLIIKPDIKINVRIGIGAVMEHFEGTAVIDKIIPSLKEMLKNDNAVIRTDACHYLMLTHNANVKASIEKLLDDKDAEVRNTALESLEEL